MPTRRPGLWTALLIAIIVVALQVAIKRPDQLQPDERTYLAIVNTLVRTGVYSDGDMNAGGVAGHPGRFIAPAFPLMVAALAKVDGTLAARLACLKQSERKALRTACGRLWTLDALQIGIAGIGMVCVFAIAWMVSGSLAVAWGSMLIALATGESAAYARLLLTDTLASTAFYLFLAAVVALIERDRAWLAAVAGAAAGLATLSRPGYAYLLYAATVAVLTLGMFRTHIATGFRPRHGIVLLAAGLAVLAPWMLRNQLMFGDVALTTGYGALALGQRVAYNAMTWSEWGAAWIFWLPDVGDDLSRMLFKPELTHRLGFYARDTFYQIGNGALQTETLAAAGGEQHHLGYLLRHYLLGDLPKHVAVTLALAWRGMWAGKWLGVIALVLAWPVVRELIRRGRLAPLSALAIPLMFMLGLHAFVSVNIVRYNVPMISLYSLIVAFAAVELWQRHAKHRGPHREPGAAT